MLTTQHWTMKLLIATFLLFISHIEAASIDVDDLDLRDIAQEFVNLPEPVSAKLMKRLGKNRDKNGLASLRYLSVITRHGSRSPTSSYPNDPYPFYNTKFWPDGPGQLTRLGKQQLYRTGLLLRKRYDGFISLNYFPNDTSVRSNPFDRDFMSAACLLAGLYPPTGFQIWNRNIAWQPIPIWEDRFDVAEIVMSDTLCPRYGEERVKTFKELDDNNGKYDELYKYLSENMGEKVDSFQSIAGIWDTLEIQSENGFRLPKWAKKVYPDPLSPMAALVYKLIVGGSDTQIRLIAGPELDMIVTQLNTKAKGEMRPNRKLYIQAAHDITLRAILSGLGIQDVFTIDTSAFMVFELHESSTGFNVRSLYFNNSDVRAPTVLDLPSCRNPCQLNDFTASIQKYIPVNWKEECHNTTSNCKVDLNNNCKE